MSIRSTTITSRVELTRYLALHGWSTTTPTPADEWQPHAWLPLRRDGRPTAKALATHKRLASLGWLDEIATDDEGAPCARIIRG